MSLRIETVTGEAALPHVPALARLRSEVFCEWPYLYRGEAEDEARYLRHYTEDEASSPGTAAPSSAPPRRSP
jgi:hypothetical protein